MYEPSTVAGPPPTWLLQPVECLEDATAAVKRLLEAEARKGVARR